MVDQNKLKQLEWYANHGYPIIPIYSIENGRCSCGKPPGECKYPGKHPRTGHGFYDATTDINRIQQWHGQYRHANWAMRTGDKSNGGAGVLVVDIDPRHGGFETWEQLRIDNPGFIETVTVNTGGGGQHLWFAYPEGYDIQSKEAALGPGVDVKANLGYVLIPPSRTEQDYTFELKPIENPIMPLPSWILSSLNGNKSQTRKNNISDHIPQGERNTSLTVMAGKMYRAGMKPEEIRTSLQAIRDERFAAGDHPVTDDEIDQVVEWISTKPRGYAFSDTGNAERFVDQHGAEVRYCFPWEKWLVWDGKRWKVDDTAEMKRRAIDTVRSIYHEAPNTHDEDMRKQIVKHALKSEAKSRIENMLNMAAAFVPVLPDELDQPPMMLNVSNGIIDLTTGDLMPHDPGYMITKIIDTEYNHQSQCPRWFESLDLWTGGDQEMQLYLQLAVGYTLTGLIDEHCLFDLFGLGANGKTTFVETIRRLMGEYAQRIDIEALLETRWRGNAANPHVAAMHGARFVLTSEIPDNRKINATLIKDLTGGDTLTARFLFSNPFTFEPTHKLWIYGNYKLNVNDDSLGFWRRMHLIPFTTTIPEEVRRSMHEVLDDFDREMPGILGWAIEGSLLWQSNGLMMPRAVKDATTEYKTEQDVVQNFIEDRCEMRADYEVLKKEIYTAWRDWCEEYNEIDALRRSQRWFTSQMQRRGFEPGGAGKLSLIGLKLKLSA